MIKLQISSKEALERLIGNDNELELELRNSIVQDFTKKHLKALATDGVVNKIGQSIKNDFEKQLFESGTKGQVMNYSNMVLSQKGLDLLKVNIQNAINEFIAKKVALAIDAYDLDGVIRKRLDYASTVILDKLTERNLEQRLNRMVDERLKAALGVKV